MKDAAANKPLVLENRVARVELDAARGGRLRSLRVFGHELLVGPPDEELDSAASIEWGCYPMAPYAGRVRYGRFFWGNRGVQLPRNLGPHAIHGTVYDQPWEVRRHDRQILRLACGLTERWPWEGQVTQQLELTERHLTMDLALHSREETFPATLGLHPWFRKRLGDDAHPALLVFAAQAMLLRDGAGITTARTQSPPPAGPWDDCFLGVTGPPMIVWPGALSLTLHSKAPYWVVFNEREDALCVEPQTGPPDALNTGSSQVVKAGIPQKLRLRLAWEAH